MTTAPAPTPGPAPVADPAFAVPVDRATLERTADALRAKGYDVHIAADLDAARELVLGLVPDGAEVGGGASKTLEDIGVRAEIEESGRYDALRPKLWAMDRQTQMREIRKLGSAPDVWLNSVHALTEDGTFVLASSTGSQLGPIASGAGKVILVVGAQKIVPDLPTAFRRIETHSLPLESERVMALYGVPSAANKILILNHEYLSGRLSVILIATAIGF